MQQSPDISAVQDTLPRDIFISNWNVFIFFLLVVYFLKGCEPETTYIDESLIFENQQGLYSGCLDYIWYTPDSLLPLSVLDVPSSEELYKNTGLPSVVFPSDHLPIYAKLMLLE